MRRSISGSGARRGVAKASAGCGNCANKKQLQPSRIQNRGCKPEVPTDFPIGSSFSNGRRFTRWKLSIRQELLKTVKTVHAIKPARCDSRGGVLENNHPAISRNHRADGSPG